MRVTFGVDAGAAARHENVPVVWDTARAVNGHALVIGMTGAGKTYTLRRMIAEGLASAGNEVPRCHVFDVHGDIDGIPGASTVRFSETTEYGLNPLTVDSDPHAGGVRKRIQSFIAAINRTSRLLGGKQEAVLRSLLTDLYAANGFFVDNPASWTLEDDGRRRFPKKYPTLQDAHRYAFHKLKSLYLGSDQKALQALEGVNRTAKALHKKFLATQRQATGPEEAERKDAELEKAIEAARVEYERYLAAIRTGNELSEFIKYDSRDVLKSVVERLENLNGIGVFKPGTPPFDAAAPVWRYDLHSLGLDERKMFVHFQLEEIFRRAVARGPQSRLRDVLVLDEGHIYLDNDPANICNTIAKEARKFGIAMVFASQSPTHFPEDVMAAVATKIILGIDEQYWTGGATKLGLTTKALAWIKPQETALIQCKQIGQTQSKFHWTHLQRAA